MKIRSVRLRYRWTVFALFPGQFEDEVCLSTQAILYCFLPGENNAQRMARLEASVQPHIRRVTRRRERDTS